MSDKSVLVFYPHDFYEMSAGTHRRVYDLLAYFKNRGFTVDLLSINGYTNRWTERDAGRRDSFDSIRLCEWRPSMTDWLGFAASRLLGGLPDFSIKPLRRAMRELTASRRYAFVVVTYGYWGALADCVADGPVKVMNFQDCLTLSYYMAKGAGRFTLGRMFEGEVRSVSKFSCALSVSEEEALLFKPFCQETSFVNVPIFCPRRFPRRPGAGSGFDILFVGSDNPFNRGGMAWFMDEVYPLLPQGVSMLVVGRICRHVGKKDNMTLIERLDDLDGAYAGARLSICPLKGGTGMKVKVVDSLSYGIPVVTTSWGLTGMLQRRGNGCWTADTPGEFARGITTLLNDSGAYDRLRGQAEAFFDGHFSTDIAYGNLDAVFLERRPDEKPGPGPDNKP
ncbi:MAG: glycosyltransferase family 4 protein [Deltaproteobacteria bacterium]|nr:glycosyltransferase family 4 protein [Deltaproteobacteria bacterium]